MFKSLCSDCMVAIFGFEPDLDYPGFQPGQCPRCKTDCIVFDVDLLGDSGVTETGVFVTRPLTRIEEDAWHNGYLTSDKVIETDHGLFWQDMSYAQTPLTGSA